jgi:hypothetical protein
MNVDYLKMWDGLYFNEYSRINKAAAIALCQGNNKMTRYSELEAKGA